MDSSPLQSSSPESEDGAARDARQRRFRALWQMSAVDTAETPSWGKRLLPVLFAAMETCWVDAVLLVLAAINFFQLRDPVMPLWAPFVLMISAAWLSTYLERRELSTSRRMPEEMAKERATPGSSAVFLVLALVTLLILWTSIYSSSLALINPLWILALLNDLLLLTPRAYHALGIILLSMYFYWRGVGLTRRTLEPGVVLRAMRLGIAIFIVGIIIRAGAGGGTYGESSLLFLLPLFLGFALIAHALAKALFVRQAHPGGFLGNIGVQEGAVLTVVGAMGVILLLVSLLVGTFASPVFLAQVQQALSPIGIAYDWLVDILAHILVFVMTPIFWLISLLPQRKSPYIQTQPPKIARPQLKPGETPAVLLWTALVIKIVLPLLCVALVCWLIWRALRRRNLVLKRRDEDLHESVWSWQLFWMQLKELFRALWLRIFARQQRTEEPELAEKEMHGEPAVRSIREVYQALLKWASGRGYPRKRSETPYEFRERLSKHLPQIDPELSAVTDAYTSVRYSEIVPDEAEVARVRGQWMALQQKEPSS